MFNSYVLHAISYKETSLIVKLFTKEHGIITLIANGAKRKTSQFYNILQPFIPLCTYWKSKNSDLNTLYKAEPQAAPYKLTSTYLFSALYINELLMKLLITQDPVLELFDNYQKFLENLSDLSKINNKYVKASIQLEQNLRFIEKQILKAIGYELHLNKESHNESVIDINANYFFDLENGLKINEIKQKPMLNDSFYDNKNLISGKSLLALHNNNFVDNIEMYESKIFMRKIIAIFLGNKQLLSRKLFV